MGVIDNEFKRLQDVVTSLEDRVKRLEQRQSGGDAASSDSVRMILMGPPGAGTFFVQFSGDFLPLVVFLLSCRHRRRCLLPLLGARLRNCGIGYPGSTSGMRRDQEAGCGDDIFIYIHIICDC